MSKACQQDIPRVFYATSSEMNAVAVALRYQVTRRQQIPCFDRSESEPGNQCTVLAFFRLLFVLQHAELSSFKPSRSCCRSTVD